MFRFIILILSILLASAGLISVFRDKKQKKKIQIVSLRLLQDLDESYENFIEKRLSLSLLEDGQNELNITNLQKEAFTVLKPQIDALIVFLTKQRKPNFYTEYDSYYFKNLSEILLQAAQNIVKFKKQNWNAQAQIATEKQQIYTALKDAISADLQKRFLDLKIKGYFEEGL